MESKEIDKIIKKVCLGIGSKLALFESCSVDEYGTTIFKLSGGINGHGNWKYYFEDLSRFIWMMEEEGFETWLIDINNDCLDDVFDARFGIAKK